MASSVEFIINLEQPRVYIKVIRYQLSKLQHEFLLIIDIDGTDRCGDICERENLLRPRFRGIKRLLRGLPTQNGHLEHHRDLDIIVRGTHTRHYIGLSSLDQVSNSFNCFRTVN